MAVRGTSLSSTKPGGAPVERNGPDGQDLAHRNSFFPGARQRTPNAKNQLVHAERFGDVIVNFELEGGNPVRLGRPGAQGDDRDSFRGRIGLEDLANFESGDAGKHEVEKDQSRILMPDHGNGPVAVVGRDNAEMRLTKIEGQHGNEIGLVLDNQDLRLHARANLRVQGSAGAYCAAVVTATGVGFGVCMTGPAGGPSFSLSTLSS